MIPPPKPNNTELLTKEQAIAFGEKGEWKSWTHIQIVEFQLYQDYFAIPADIDITEHPPKTPHDLFHIRPHDQMIF